MAGFHVASEKMCQPGQSSWFGPPTGDISNVRRSDQPISQPYFLPTVDARPSSRGSSVNFSYPARARPMSPESPSSPVASEVKRQEPLRRQKPRRRPSSEPGFGQNLVYDPNSRRMLPKTELFASEHQIQFSPDSPIRKKDGSRSIHKASSRKIESPGDSQGSSSLQGSCGASVSPVRPFMSQVEADGSSKRAASPLKDGGSPAIILDTMPGATANRSLTTSQSTQVIAKKPSVVKEEPALEDEAERKSDQAPERWPSSGTNHLVLDAFSSRNMATDSRDINRSAIRKSPHIEIPIARTLPHERTQSNSPIRAPRFALTPENLTVRHSPPPRSLSPIKSALKQYTLGRDLSPSSTSESSSTAWPINSSQSQPQIEPKRKKSVRVTFDDKKMRLGDETPTSEDDMETSKEGQARRPWYHLGRAKKTGLLNLDDGLMKPRPALPSFGSVRGQKPRGEDQVEERPLVRPFETGHMLSHADPSSLHNGSHTGDSSVAVLSSSSDHVIGAEFEEFESQKPLEPASSANPEPLPPVVTSIEGYMSDGESVSSFESDHIRQLGTQPWSSSSTMNGVLGPPQIQQAPENGIGVSPSFIENSTSIHVPVISITQPSPRQMEETCSPILPFPPTDNPCPDPEVPGGFPSHESENSDNEPTPKPSPLVLVERPATSSSPLLAPLADDDSSSESSVSIYIDACEDLSGVEESGFISLDAVVESPTSSGPSLGLPIQQAIQPTTESIASTPTKKSPPSVSTEATIQASPSDVAAQPPSPPVAVPRTAAEEWEHAKAYWKSLSVEQRRQLELEALEESGLPVESQSEQIQVLERHASTTSLELQSELTTEKKQSLDRRKRESILRAEIVHARTSTGGERVYQILPGAKATHDLVPSPKHGGMRTTLREEAHPLPRETKLKKSLRSTGNSNRTPDPIVSSQSSRRGLVQPKSFPQSRLQTHVHTIYDAEAGSRTSGPNIRSSLRRSGSSDSISSFKRSRRPSGRQGFPQSMRNQPPPVTKATGKFRLRSLSPTGARVPFRHKSVESAPIIIGPVSSSSHLKTTLRSGPQSDLSNTMSQGIHLSSLGSRGSGGKRKHSFLSFSKGTSRFDESSDEDIDVPSHFRSRFVDSSDEEGHSLSKPPMGGGLLAKTMRTVPRQSVKNEGLAVGTAPPSSDIKPPLQIPAGPRASSLSLPDTCDENASLEKAFSPPTRSWTSSKGKTLRRSGSGRDSLAPAVSSSINNNATTLARNVPARSSQDRKRRSSLMSVLRRKKHDPSSGIYKAEATESFARRDTKLERSRSELASIRQPSSGTDANWPLSGDVQAVSNNGRLPLNELSDGEEEERKLSAERTRAAFIRPTNTHRLNMAFKQASHGAFAMAGSMDVDDSGSTATGTPSHLKKKKFGALRRMLRLND